MNRMILTSGLGREERFYTIAADVLSVGPRTAMIRPAGGPQQGRIIEVPLSLFEDSEFVEAGDDEVTITLWWLIRNRLMSEGPTNGD